MMIRLLISIFALLQLVGCAGFLHGDTQSVRISTMCHGRAVPATCTAENSKGTWTFSTPADIDVKKDVYGLAVTCKSPFYEEVEVVVPSSVNLSSVGNILVGGLVGVTVDVYTGAGFVYNQDVRISYPTCQ